MTGKDDYVSNGEAVYKLSNGSELLGQITGGGCIVGSVLAAFCGVEAGKQQPSENLLVGGDMLLATIAGSVYRTYKFPGRNIDTRGASTIDSVLAITIASEKAAAREDVKGSGTFLPALIDEVGKLQPTDIEEHGRVSRVEGS